MRHFLTVLIFSGLAFLPLTACSNSAQQNMPAKTEHSEDDGHDHSKDKDHLSKGGQVVESGPYHIELVSNPENDGIRLNLYLLYEAEERAIADAQVTANVQQPNGEQKTIKLLYEPTQKSYNGLLTAKAKGRYNLVVQTSIDGKKINSRFKVEK